MKEKLIAAGINYDKAIEISGDEQILLIVIQAYMDEFEGTYARIKKDFREKDIEDYTILVHGVKGASRTIGLTELGDLAEKLQFAGEASDMEMIEAMTDEFLEMYKSAVENLKGVIG